MAGGNKEFNNQNLNDLRKDFDLAVADLAKKYGIAIRLGGIRYDASKATAPNGASTANSREAIMAADFSRYAPSFGLKPEQYGATFKHGRETYKLVGFKPRSRRPRRKCSRSADVLIDGCGVGCAFVAGIERRRRFAY